MILVLLGTFHIEFKRPLIALHELCEQGKLHEEIIVQNGFTNFDSPYLTMQPFLAPAELDRLYDEARLIITHAGTGSIIKGIKKGKKVITIARLFKNEEHIDDHQLEIMNEFAGLHYIYPWGEDDSLEDVLQNVENFIPEQYVSRKKDIVTYLKSYIDSL